MGYAELISKLEALPSEKRAEVFDFIEFLSARCDVASGKALPHDEWSDAEFSRMAMQQALRGIEDEPVAYTRSDLRESWQ